jgi:hypothetical protein
MTKAEAVALVVLYLAIGIVVMRCYMDAEDMALLRSDKEEAMEAGVASLAWPLWLFVLLVVTSIKCLGWLMTFQWKRKAR